MAENTEGTSTETTATTGTEATPAPVEREYSDVEQKALTQGWVPEDQYEGTGKWRDAEEFLDRGELFQKIDEQNRRIKSAEQTAQALKKHLEQVRKNEYQRALNSLKADKKTALTEGDADKVIEIDEAIANTRAKAAQEEVQAQQANTETVPNPQFLVWVNKNSWYSTDKAMKVYADSVGDELVYGGMNNPAEVLAEVERRVKKEFAHKFNNPNRTKPGTVEGGSNKGTQSKDTFQLNDDERRVMNKFIKAGLMTEKEYIADLKAERGA